METGEDATRPPAAPEPTEAAPRRAEDIPVPSEADASTGSRRRERNNQRRRQRRSEERSTAEEARNGPGHDPGRGSAEGALAKGKGKDRAGRASGGQGKGDGRTTPQQGTSPGHGSARHGGRPHSDPGTAHASATAGNASSQPQFATGNPPNVGPGMPGVQTGAPPQGWWWHDGQEWYFTAAASAFKGQFGASPPGGMPQGDPSQPSGGGKGQNNPGKGPGQATAAPAPGGDPGGGGSGSAASNYTYEEEESEEEELNDPDPPISPPPATTPKARPKKKLPQPVQPPRSQSSRPGSEGQSSVAPTDDLRDMLRAKAATERSKPALHQVKLENFYGSRTQYRDWKRVLTAQRALYNLGDSELAMLVYLSCKGDARQILNQLEIEEMTAVGGLTRMLGLLEEAYGSRSDERFEERQDAYLQFRRSPGQPMAQFIASLKRLRQEYLREDSGTVISDKSFAQRMLARAGLTRKERMDCFFSAGGKYRSGQIERVLRFRCAKIHEDESRKPAAYRAKDEASSSSREPLRRRYPARSSKKYQAKGYRGRRVYHAEDEQEYEDEGPEDPDDEDLEQEVAQGRFDEQQYDDEEDWSRNDAWYEHQYRDDEDWHWDYEEEDEDEDDEYETATAQELSEAYAAGWRAKSQAAAHKQSRGYKGGGKTERVRGPDKRKPDDRKKRSTCSSCGKPGHWKGDPECPRVVSGEEKLHPRHERRVNEANVTTTLPLRTPTSPTSTSPVSAKAKTAHPVKEEPSPSSGSVPAVKTEPEEPNTKVTKVNWTMMVDRDEPSLASSWELLRDYQSDSDDSMFMSSDSGDEQGKQDFLQAETRPPEQKKKSSKPSKGDFKVALQTVLRALDYTEEETDKELRKKHSKDLKLRPQELLQLLPHMTKDEKRMIYKMLKTEQELVAAETLASRESPLPEMLRRPDRRRSGYRAPRDAATSSTAAAAAPRSSRASSSEAAPPGQEEIPAAVKKKQLESFRRSLYDNAVGKRGALRPSQASEYPNAEQENCPHSFEALRWGANASAHWAHCSETGIVLLNGPRGNGRGRAGK